MKTISNPQPVARTLAAQTEENLNSQVLAKWFPAAVNTEIGGFDQDFAADWTNFSQGSRSLVFQSRLTWLAAQTALHYPGQMAKWAAHSNYGAAYLQNELWDRELGGFFWALDQGLPQLEGEKHTYGLAFAIYALAANSRVAGSQNSLELAQQTFLWLDHHAHDARNGGYFEALSREGTPILSGQGVDAIGTRYGLKSMNTHIHLLEAFAALYEVWPHEKLRVRLQEVFGLVRDTIVVSPTGSMNLFFTLDWQPLTGAKSYGHDIETAYLLIEAAAALNMPDDERTWTVARQLVDHTLDYGHDPENGGFYDEGDIQGGVTSDAKVWWVQAEALNALLLMHHRYGTETCLYWDAFVAQWKFIRRHQIDAEHGGWHQQVSREGTAVPGAPKSDGWTDGYHQGRALFNVSRLLYVLAAQSP